MLNFLDGLYKYPKPGFNALEREWYWDHVISNEGLLAEYQNLAEKVAADKGKSVNEILEIFLAASGKQAESIKEAMGAIGGHLVAFQQLEAQQAKRQRNAPNLLTEMFLRSRLKPDWLISNESELWDIYGVDIKASADHLSTIRRSSWLSDDIRRVIIQEIVSLMTTAEVREIKEAAELEMNEGRKLELTPQGQGEAMGKPENGSTGRSKTPKQKEKVLKMPTSESQSTA